MRITNALLGALLCAVPLLAQVLSPEEIRDPQMKALQRKHFDELKLITKAAASHSFPYHFYFSRTLDLPEKDQPRNDQRAIQFDRYQDQTVLKITGNYFAAYSTELMKPEERARKTYEDVMVPLLQASVAALEKTDEFRAFAFEISHHVRKKVLGVSSEGVENVVLILPKVAAQRLIAASDAKSRQAALFEGQAFLNSVSISFWPRPEREVAQYRQEKAISDRLINAPGILAKEPAATVPSLKEPPSRDTSPDGLKKTQSSYQADFDKLVQELDVQANFIRYAPPAFIPFHGGLYLQISVAATLPQAAAGSQYRLAALAFDQHIVHLIRPVLAYFKAGEDFDGIDFSTTVRLAGDQSSGGSPVAVEFISPLKLLRSYAQFDCTGQQLIDAGFVLINGERVSLNLQVAETSFKLQ
jgi:hypothetical protein